MGKDINEDMKNQNIIQWWKNTLLRNCFLKYYCVKYVFIDIKNYILFYSNNFIIEI